MLFILSQSAINVCGLMAWVERQCAKGVWRISKQSVWEVVTCVEYHNPTWMVGSIEYPQLCFVL